MRVWHIPYCYLDDKRLLAQHNEVHGLLTCILEGKQWGSITAEFKHSCQYLEEVHDRVVKELRIREVRRYPDRPERPHASPLRTDIPGLLKKSPYEPGRERLVRDVSQLRAKWEAEGYDFGVGRVDLRYAEEQLGLKQGRTWDSIVPLQAATRAFVKAHREELNKMKGTLGAKLELLKFKEDPTIAPFYARQVLGPQDGESDSEGQVRPLEAGVE